ncbi:MAG: extracellular solute-binding protein [Defluviitaleaceae bacterium]|nr:extracellular solute-binding protein [Defluviitaleaceae bacterium]
MKKLFLLVAVLAMFTLVFAACGGDDEPGPAPPAPADTTSGGTDAPTEVEPAEPSGRLHPIRDFGGRSLRVAAWWADPMISQLAWGEEPDPFESENYHVARLTWDNVRRVEELFNMTFEQVVIPHDDYMEMIATSVLAGEPLADIVTLEGWMQLIGIQNDLLRPWSAASNLPNSDLFGPNVYMSPMTVSEGEVWTIRANGPFAGGWGIGVNLDIINADGLPNPVDLYESGNWNWDTMLDIMRRATRSTDGTGIINQFGIAGNPGGGNTGIAYQLIAANDGILMTEDFYYAFDHPHTVRAFEFLQTIFTEQLWASDNGAWSDDWSRNFFAGKREGNSALFMTTTWAIQDAPPAFEFRFVPIPLGPDNTSGNSWNMGWRQSYALTAASDWDVEDILVIIEELFSWPCDDPELLWEAGDYAWMLTQFQTHEDVMRGIHIGNTGGSDLALDVSGYSYVIGEMVAAFFNQEMDVMQAIEYHRGPSQEILDQRFRQ